MPSPRWFAPAPLSFITALALYAVTLRGTLVYDDVWLAGIDPRLHDVHQWGKFLYEAYYPDGLDNLWRPLTSLSLAIQCQLTGQILWPFHAVNILLHAMASAMVALLAGRLARRSDGVAAYVAGLLFAAHPVHVEAVAEIVGRAEAMVVIGFIGALLLLIDRPLTPRRAWAITGCFLVALFSKEQGILLPVTILTWSLLTRRPNRIAATAKGTWWLTFLLAATLAVYVNYRNHILPWYWERSFMDPDINPIAFATGWDRWLIPVATFGRYAQLAIAPILLSPEYGANTYSIHQSWSDPYLYGGMLFILVWVTGLAISIIQGRKVVTFCLVGLGLSLGMVTNWIIIGTVFGDRLLYLPTVFICILAGVGAARVVARLQWRTRDVDTAGKQRSGVGTYPVVYGAFLTVLLLFSVRTVTYAWRWNERLRLHQYALAQRPESVRLYIALAVEYDVLGDTDRADATYTAGKQACPNCWSIYHRAAMFELSHDRLDAAYDDALKAVKLRGMLFAMGVIQQIEDRRKELQHQ